MQNAKLKTLTAAYFRILTYDFCLRLDLFFREFQIQA